MSTTPKIRTLCPFTLAQEVWVEEEQADGTWLGRNIDGAGQIQAQDLIGLETAYEIHKSISLRLRDLKSRYGTWAAALEGYQEELGEPPYHDVVRVREPFLDRIFPELRALALKEGSN